jgi:hypothetical protein
MAVAMAMAVAVALDVTLHRPRSFDTEWGNGWI